MATQDVPDRIDDRAETEQAARAVREGVIRLARRLQAQRQEHALGPTAVALLSRLRRDGPATAKALADAEGALPQSLTRTIASLEEQGYVARRDHPTDGRQVLLSLTPSGLDVLRRHGHAQVGWLASAMAAELTGVERDVLRVAARLLEQLAEHGVTPPALVSVSPGRQDGSHER